MPTNLPPECINAEQRYREAKTPTEKIEHLETYISLIPKHKGTDKLRADLRRKLSKLRSAAQSKKGSVKHESPFLIDKEGAGQVAVVGPPNVGKSSLLRTVTHATPEVAAFPFSTWTATPGMMPVEDIQIQLLDTPPLNREHMEADFLDLIRRADLVVLMVDLQTAPVEQLQDSIALLQEHHIVPNRLKQRYPDDQRIKVLPFLVVVNKDDDDEADEVLEIFEELLDEDWPYLPISVQTGRNLDALKQRIVEKLKIIRVYSKAPGKPADSDDPFVLTQGATVDDFAAKVHHDFVHNLKFAKIWGTGVYNGQMVQRDHVLHDGDIVELHT